MCTSIVEIARAEGMAKRGDEWFPLSLAVVAYDHARHAPLGDVITLDFINTDLDPGARAGLRMRLREPRRRLDRTQSRGTQAPLGSPRSRLALSPRDRRRSWSFEEPNIWGHAALTEEPSALRNRAWNSLPCHFWRLRCFGEGRP
jgi:hypothetical protein